MHDRYAGDARDFGKFALLRALSPGRRLGVGWYLTSGSSETNNDGGHLRYLEQPERFDHLDHEAFAALRAFAERFRRDPTLRSVASLERLALLSDSTLFHGELCPPPGPARRAWGASLVDQMDPAELVFLDPDNGLAGATESHKSVGLGELQALRKRGRALLVYHHQSRLAGGARAEFEYQARRLGRLDFMSVRAARLRPYSSRFYFLLDADPEITARLEELARRWDREAEMFSG